MTLHSLAVLAADPKINPDTAGTKIKGLLMLAFGLVCIAIAVQTAWKRHSAGEMKKAAQSLGVVVIAFSIAALGVTAGLGMLWGAAILNFAKSVTS